MTTLVEEHRNGIDPEKLESLQIQPQGRVLQMDNWQPGDRLLSLGNILKLTWQAGIAPDSPSVDRRRMTLEESFLEMRESELPARDKRHSLSSNAVAEIPFGALAVRGQMQMLQRNNLAGGTGTRLGQATVLGNAGLVLAQYAPILARMNVKMGVVGSQRLGYFTAQGTGAPAAESAAITVQTWTTSGDAREPITIPSTFEMSSSLRAIDDGTFEQIAEAGVSAVLNNEVVKQVLIGTGAAPQIEGLWARVDSAKQFEYGAAPADFTRSDILSAINGVRLSDTDGASTFVVASEGLWNLMESEPRGAAGTSGQGYSEISRYVLDDVRPTGSGVMGMVEGAECIYYSDLAVTGVTNPGLIVKGDRVQVWFWGDSLTLEYVPELAASHYYKMCAEINYDVVQPDRNIARIAQS